MLVTKFTVVSAAQWIYSTRNHVSVSTEVIFWNRQIYEDRSMFETERIEKMAIKDYFRALFRHWSEGTGEKHETFQSRQLVCRSKFQAGTYMIYSWTLLLKPTCSVNVNLLKPTGHVTHQQFNIQQLYVLPTLYLFVLYLSDNKQRLVPLTA